MRATTLLTTLLLLAAPAVAQQNDLEQLATRSYTPLSETSAAERTALRQIEAHLGFLASDAMGGRDTATVEAAITAEYVAAQLHMYGFEPGGEGGTFFQTFPLRLTSLDLEGLRCELRKDGEVVHAFAAEDDYAVRGYSGAGFDLEGGLVFAGHGLVDSATGTDDYEGLDVEGRFVVVIGGAPEVEEIEPSLIVASNWRAKEEQAKQRGAAGLLIVNPPGDDRAAQWFRRAKARMRSESMGLGGKGPEAAAFPRYYVEPHVAETIFAAAGHDFAEAIEDRAETLGVGGFALDGLTLSAAAPVNAEDLVSDNTIGLLRGTDPELADEVIVLSAHMDHVGIDDAGEIYNGADDNATGTTTLLLVAQALARDPSRLGRSVAILGVTGEEKGLLGSEWWVAHPTIEIENVVANINIDMVGRNEPDAIGVTPSPEHPDFNSLVTLAQSLAPEAGIDVEWFAGAGDLRRRVDEYYYRSDHVNFARAGIPVIFFFAGEHEDYHKPTDTVDKIDTRKVLKVADLVTLLVRSASQQPERPVKLGKSSGDRGR